MRVKLTTEFFMQHYLHVNDMRLAIDTLIAVRYVEKEILLVMLLPDTQNKG